MKDTYMDTQISGWHFCREEAFIYLFIFEVDFLWNAGGEKEQTHK